MIIGIYVTNNFAFNSGSTSFFTNMLDCFDKLDIEIYAMSRFKINKEFKNIKVLIFDKNNNDNNDNNDPLEKFELEQIYNYHKKYNFVKIFVRNNIIIDLLPNYVKDKPFRNIFLFWFWSGTIFSKKYFNHINRNNVHLTNSNSNREKLNYFKNLKIFMPLISDEEFEPVEKNNNEINIIYFGSFKNEYLIGQLMKLYVKKKLYKYFNLDCFIVRNRKLKYSSKGLNIYYNLTHDELVSYIKNKHYDFSFNLREIDEDIYSDPSSKLIESIQYNIKPIVNRNSYTKELLGSNYPFYFKSISKMINFLKIYNPDNYDYKLNKSTIDIFKKNRNINVIKDIFYNL